LENTLTNYVELVELMNTDSEVFDFEEVNVNDPKELINYYNRDCDSDSDSSEEDSHSEEEQAESDQESEHELPPPPTIHKRVLRSNSKKIVDYGFDRDYNIQLKTNSNKSHSQKQSTLGISGKNWHLD
tara:strand:+ start:362 stop:745 length:384 start_codon:yes stop_codon:yes gene_type:complete